MREKVLPINIFYIYMVLMMLPILNFGDFGLAIIHFVFVAYTGSNSMYKNNKSLINQFALVFVLCVIQSFVFFIFNGMPFKYLSRGISTSLNAILCIFVAFRSCDIYGDKAIDYIVKGYIMGYFLLIISAIGLFGFYEVYQNIFAIFTGGFTSGGGTDCEGYLEQTHAFLLIAPYLSLVYLWYCHMSKQKKYLIIALVLMVMSLCAYKRIAIGAALILSVFFFLRRLYNKKIILLSTVICIGCLLFYIYIIKTGIIYFYASLYDIDLMFRDRLWPEFEDLYNFDVSYMGKGWDFVSKYLHENNEKLTGTNIGGLHNDILKIYIDLGFFGFIAYFGILLCLIPLKLIKQGYTDASFLWWTSQLYLVIIYLTDNAMIYGVCQIVVYALVFANIHRQRCIEN